MLKFKIGSATLLKTMDGFNQIGLNFLSLQIRLEASFARAFVRVIVLLQTFIKQQGLEKLFFNSCCS